MGTKTIFEAQTLAEFVQLLLKEANLSQDRLSELTGVAKGTINKIATGATLRPDPDTLDKIASYAHVTRRWLYSLAYDLEEIPDETAARRFSALRELLETAPDDIQRAILAAARAMIASRDQEAHTR